MCEAAGGVDDEGVAAHDDGFAAGFFGEALDKRRSRRARLSGRLRRGGLRLDLATTLSCSRAAGR